MREEKRTEEKHHVYHGRSTQPRAQWMLLKCALWHSGQVLMHSVLTANDLRCFCMGVCEVCGGLWVSVLVSVFVSVDHESGSCLCVCVCFFSNVFICVCMCTCVHVHVQVHVHVCVFCVHVYLDLFLDLSLRGPKRPHAQCMWTFCQHTCSRLFVHECGCVSGCLYMCVHA